MESFDTFRFAEPGWALALWVVAFAVVLLLWLEQRGTRALDRLVSPALQVRLVERPRRAQRVLRIVFLGLSAVCLVLSLMRPQWGLRHVPVERSGAQIMIALDVSRSMLAEDVAPNRLARAKAEIVDLLGYLEGDQVGLIAFGGRATVLSPLTPDFGFLQLGLANAGPGSAGRGGTRLEEPLRKAIAGFAGTDRGESAGSSRALILITDGEDHGSFPLDAAKAAAEAGILVIAIGIGNEEGSEIRITNPRTGARERLRDADGEVVLSRLDGDLLRRIAEETGGAYVPAGTATLDLESIYREYIGPMTRGQFDPRGRVVRDELYPAFVILGLLLLLGSVGVSSAPSRTAIRGSVALLALFAVASESRAQPAANPGPVPPELERTAPRVEEIFGELPGGLPADVAEREELPPREEFNRGVEALEERDFETAIEHIQAARRGARDDPALRFRAAYDLGWLAVQRAGRIEGESPREALGNLVEAIEWFHEASRLDPDDEDARANLEVAQRRALLLEDQLARQGMGGVEERLEELAQRQRALATEVAELHGASAAAVAAGDPNATDGFREQFRGRASGQREVLSEADAVAHAAGRERDVLEERGEAERSTEDEVRIAQLGNALHYLHRAREKMGQARRQLRRRQGDSAYRRAASALLELERALDQFLQPVECIDRLLADEQEIFDRTRVLASQRRDLGSRKPGGARPGLSREALAEEQVSLAGRTAELEARLRAGSDRGGDDGAPATEEGGAAAEAVPRVAEAANHFLTAVEDLAAENLQGAQLGQLEGLRALAAAREVFLDIPGLIEAAYGDEVQIARVLASDLPDPGPAGSNAGHSREEYLPSLRETQAVNRARGERLARKIETRRQGLSSATGPSGAPPDPQAVEGESRRLEAASEILERARSGMEEVGEHLSSEPVDEVWPEATRAAIGVVRDLERLRRIFFSIVERVREVAHQELELSDATRDASARIAGEPGAAQFIAGSLGQAQSEVAARTLGIANELKEQSELAPTDEPGAEEVSLRLRQAAEHAVLAEMEMTGAVEALELPEPDFASAQPRQHQAGVELAAVLELLEPPQENPGEESESESEPQPESESGSEEQESSPSPGETPEPVADPGQLLQAVRDQEAERRGQRARAQGRGDAVEKDW